MLLFQSKDILFSSESLTIQLQRKKKLLVFSITGDFSGKNGKDGMNAIFDSITHFENIVFSFSNVQFVDTYVLRRILELYEKLHAREYSVVFLGLSNGVKGIMRGNGILDVIAHYGLEKDAVHALNSNDYSRALPVYSSEIPATLTEAL